MPDTILYSLYERAIQARNNAYAPYSNYKVGATLITDTGKVFAGCNAETASYKGTCAEAGAIAAMIEAGERVIHKVVIVGPNNDECPPCGDCRQRLREFIGDRLSLSIATFSASGTLLGEYSMEDLLPKSFGPDNLKGI